MHSSQPTQPLRKYVRLLLLLAASVTSCATTSPVPSLPVVSRQVTIPSPPVVNEPMPQGAYFKRHCELVQYAQAMLKTTLQESELCGVLGR